MPLWHPAGSQYARLGAIRAEGERLAYLAEANAFPFDRTHTDFRPDPSWPILDLPPGWDRARTTG